MGKLRLRKVILSAMTEREAWLHAVLTAASCIPTTLSGLRLRKKGILGFDAEKSFRMSQGDAGLEVHSKSKSAGHSGTRL